MPNKISISGHTDAKPFRGSRAGFGNWELSSNRSLESRRALIQSGLPMDRISHVIGKADTEPLVRDAPNDARNRRISIVLLREATEKAAAIKAERAKKAAKGAAKAGAPAETQSEPAFRRDWSGPRLK